MASARPRPPVQAGRFYPDDPDELRGTIRDMLDQAPKAPIEGFARGFLAPHAGYIFSGPIAAHVYKQIEGMDVGRVVILAPSHQCSRLYAGASIYDGPAYATPLGHVPLDRNLIEALRFNHPDLFTSVPEAHACEHSIEVHLPFLQVALREFKIVPLLIQDQSEQNVMSLSKALLEVLESHAPVSTIFLASSDLYHGHNYDEACLADHRFEEALSKFEPRQLLRQAMGGECQACGVGPIAAAMELSRQVGAAQVKILSRSNSRDINPMPGSTYVVGYAAAMFY